MNESSIPFSLIFLAGGIGSRLGSPIPKQYISLGNKPLALHSFEQFLSLPELTEVIVVCEPQYQSLFASYGSKVDLHFASPGKRRQDSVFNGLQKVSLPLACIHDSARPFISPSLIRRVVQEGQEWGAAALGTRVKSTIKVCDGAQVVINTPNRDHLWEIQTPQAAHAALLREGFREAEMKKITVTDDVSLIELIGQPVKIVEGSPLNIKVTTQEDLLLVEQLLDKYVCL